MCCQVHAFRILHIILYIKVGFMMFNKREAGFSLIEMLLVLGVLAVLLIAAFVVYPRVRLAQQVHVEKENLSILQAGIQSKLAAQNGNYTSLGAIESGIGNTFANRAKITPESMNNGNFAGSSIVNSWGGTVIIHATGGGSFDGYQSGRAFGIQYNGVPKEACAQFVLGSIGNFVAAWVNGSTGAGTYLTPKNASPERVIERCEAQEVASIHFVSE